MSKAELLKRAMAPKSDQLNADDLIASPITIVVTGVDVSASGEQKVSVHYQNENGRPYKPCKSMMRIMSFAWGEDPEQWVGQSATLYNDISVAFGGEKVGGIRISHMSGIEKPIELALQKSKGKKQQYKVLPMNQNRPQSQPRQQVQQPEPTQPPAQTNQPTQAEIDRYVQSQKPVLEDAAKISMEEFIRVWGDTKYKPMLTAFKDELKAKYFPPAPPVEQTAQSYPGRDPNELLAELNSDRGVEGF